MIGETYRRASTHLFVSTPGASHETTDLRLWAGGRARRGWRQVEADRALAARPGVSAVRRTSAAGYGLQGGDADPAAAGDGGGRDRRPQGLPGDPAPRRVFADGVRRLAGPGPEAAVRLGAGA